MTFQPKNLLCRYNYDPLDQLVDCTPTTQERSQRFYLKNRLTTEIQGSTRHSVFQQGNQLLAQQLKQDNAVRTTLLTTDQQQSVLQALNSTQLHALVYTPYGYQALENGLLCLLGFNGERPDPVTGRYLLGNGYRAFNPVLMRFDSPDSLSPFGKGGLNAYAYCTGDPLNRKDPTGHNAFLSMIGKAFSTLKPRHLFKKSTQKAGENDVLLGYHGSHAPQHLKKARFFKARELFVTDNYEHAKKYAGEKGTVFAAYVEKSALSEMSARYAPKTNASSMIQELPINIPRKKLVKAVPIKGGDAVDLDEIFGVLGRTHEEHHIDILKQLHRRLEARGIEVGPIETISRIRSS
ncbi:MULTISPECIES: RHS repeat-associated core domain-containing protein [Pseudomonas]|uniref:RHS repeat-associated core domain-containing protein n=1 Tax=Pseudomonas TaxID=286 RepID=UPI001BEA8549|nr:MULTISPECIES: RHS repeat-associated core domain-containing protein [Pseudomonas]MBT2340992.1 RHS repeat-associated core domain-containing protein [Pseudomonas fluorescens]MCD4532466.1 RHS repeat-associated core domain-containing protein [Pseudomonas sp. C3-2018]